MGFYVGKENPKLYGEEESKKVAVEAPVVEKKEEVAVAEATPAVVEQPKKRGGRPKKVS